MVEVLATHLPCLSRAQQRGLALWVFGAILSCSSTESQVVNALRPYGKPNTIRQRLREWLRDGRHKVAPCRTQVEVETCFAPLMRWLLCLWQSRELALALDASLKQADHVCLCLSVLYRGTAAPIAWKVLPANCQGTWLTPIQEMIRALQPAIPKHQRVLFLADRGLWSPDLWDTVRAQGWHPVMRVQEFATFQSETGLRGPMSQYVPGAGHAWIGRGQAFTHRHKAATLVVVFAKDQKAPWCLLTDLPVDAVPLMAYGLRVWIEAGFRTLKSLGWEWDRIRRTDPVRLDRYFLVLSIATLWGLWTGTRVEDAEHQGIPVAALRHPVPVPKKIPRTTSVIKQGLVYLRRQLTQGRVWTRGWLTPEPYPPVPEGLCLTIARPT